MKLRKPKSVEFNKRFLSYVHPIKKSNTYLVNLIIRLPTYFRNHEDIQKNELNF